MTKEEQEILDAYESGEFTSIPDVKEEMAKYREAEGLPYQTLITSVLHKFVSGTL